MVYNIFSRIKVIEDIQKDIRINLKDDISLVGQPFEIQAFERIEIDSDVDNLTDTCTITLPLVNMEVKPNKLKYFGYKSEEECVLKIGDIIEIELAYYTNEAELTDFKNSKIPKVFVGYISKFSIVDNSVEIHCEDAMWLLKKSKISFSLTKPTLHEILHLIGQENKFPPYPFELFYIYLPDTTFGNIRTSGYLTGAEVLQQLKDEYGLYFYFKNWFRNKDTKADTSRQMTNTRLMTEFYETFPNLIAGFKYPLIEEADYPGFIRHIKFEYPYTLNLIDNKYTPILENNLEYIDFNKKDELIVIGTTTAKDEKTKITIATVDGVNIIFEAKSGEKGEEKTTYVKKIGKTVSITRNVTPLKTDDWDDLVKSKEYRVDLNLPELSFEDLVEYVLNAWNTHPESGFEGSFETFGEPMVCVGDIVDLKILNTTVKKDMYADEDFIFESYYVDAVQTNVEMSNGFSQIIKIGSKINI